MTEHIYTEDKIIELLTAYIENRCDTCNVRDIGKCCSSCYIIVIKRAIDLINSQMAKIERLKEKYEIVYQPKAMVRDEAIKEVVSETIDIIKQRIKDDKYLVGGVSSDIWKAIHRGRQFAYRDIKEIIEQKYGEAPSPTPNNMCICCGEIIPEGRQVCPACEKQLKNYKPKGVKTKTVGKYVAPDLGVQLTIDDMENNND